MPRRSPWKTAAGPRRFPAGMKVLSGGAGAAAHGGTIEGGAIHDLRGLDWRQWMRWLRKRG